MTSPSAPARRHQRALLAGVDADRLAFFQKQERRQRAPRFHPSRRYQLRRSKMCIGGKSRSSASRSSIYAIAELVVPRSMPIFMLSISLVEGRLSAAGCHRGYNRRGKMPRAEPHGITIVNLVLSRNFGNNCYSDLAVLGRR